MYLYLIICLEDLATFQASFKVSYSCVLYYDILNIILKCVIVNCYCYLEAVTVNTISKNIHLFVIYNRKKKYFSMRSQSYKHNFFKLHLENLHISS